MAKQNSKIIFLILLFLNLFEFSFQEKHEGTDDITTIIFDIKSWYSDYEVENSKKSQRFRLSFDDKSKSPFYMKIEVTSTDNNPSPILCFSSTDQNCEDRQQIVKNPNGKSSLIWIKREQYNKDEENLYIKIICQEEGAGYILSFTGNNEGEYEPNFVYSYLVNSYNREMIFNIKGNNKTGIVVIAIEGSKSPSLTSEKGQLRQTENGYVVFVRNEYATTGKITTITVKGTPDDYLTLSSHLINNDESSEVLEPNGPEINGYLEKGVIEQDCFKIKNSANKLYLTGRLHSMFGLFYLKDDNQKIIESSKEEIINGHLSKVIDSNSRIKEICLGLPESSEIIGSHISFTISLSEPITLNSLYNYYPPQIPGKIYRRFLPKGYTAYYYSMEMNKASKKYNFNVYSIKGYSKMGIAKCSDYPFCQYKNVDGLDIPKTSNQMSIWTSEEVESSTLGKTKNVIVVECKDDDNEGNGYCLFETSFISKEDIIYLVPNEKFSYFVIKEEKGAFKLNIGNGIKAQGLLVDIMIFSGDVSFNLKEDDSSIDYHKYYLSNKVLFQLNLAQNSKTSFNLEFTAALNSFFTIQYEFNMKSQNQIEEIVPSGESYLVQIDPTSSTRKKTIHLQNFRYKKENPFLANFFALNCEFEVNRDGEVSFFDGYAQEVLNKTSKEYKSEAYNYEIKIKEPDLSNYNHKMCMLYVGGIESDDDYQKEIIISENINQQIIFENGFKKVRFLFPQADNEKDLAIYVNVIDKANYQMKIILNNNNNPLQIHQITRTQIFYLSKNDISGICKVNKLCSIIVEVELISELVKTNPMIEITIRQIKNIPSYIQKGIAKRDFTCGDNFYYLYMDIGKNEAGEVLVDFLRDFGNLWGKIVRKDQTSVDEEANWRGIYRMPSEEWEDSLEYNGYIKKLLIKSEDTQDCIEGCYLLLSIRISQIGDYVDNSKFYPFSILTKITPNNRAYTDIPKVVIQVDEYIIGNVDVSINERISDFYEVWLPHDATRVDFDWQSGVAGLYINLGGIRPTTKNADFTLIPPGKDSILSLTKDQIYQKAKAKRIDIPNEDSIQDLSLVIGVWTDKTSAVDTEIYSLRVHEVNENDDKLDIIEVNADKKIMCKPHELPEGKYRCLFMVTYDNDDTILSTPFFGHASSVDVSSMTYMYASFVDRNIYDEFKNNELTREIPTFETATYNSKEDGVDYIFIKNLDKTKYLFINVIVDSKEDVMFLSNMPLYNYISLDMFEFYPTPGKEQLLHVSSDQLRLQFATEDSIMVNIVTLTGEAEIFWRKDSSTIYSLRGRGDRLTLISGQAADHLVIRKRKNQANKLQTKMEDPGFLFYISYYLKESKQNFDEVIYGRSLEFGYIETDLPVVLYSKIGDYSSDINVAVTFKDLQNDESGFYPSSPLDVRASLIKENAVYKAKKDPELAPAADRLILGSYDIALKTAQVMLSSEIISTYNLKPTDNPTLYLSIEKNFEFSEKIYNKFNVEIQFSKANEGVIPTEKVYHYGRLGDKSRLTYYKLRIDKQKPFMRIQVAFNSDNTDFYISDKFSWQRTNMTGITSQKERGKIFATLSTEKLNLEYIYLIFYQKKETDIKNLYNYVFKYINAGTKEEFVDHKILDDENIIYKENINDNNPEESTIECTFHKIDIDKSKANITYFFKVVDSKSYIKGENSDTIAVMESPYYSVYARNPQDNNGLITLTAKGNLKKWTMLQVIAQVQQETILEYVSYKGKYIYREPDRSEDNNSDNNSNDSTDPTMFYVVGGILLVLVVGLIVAIVIFKIRNQELVEQVKHVSFQKTNSSNYNNNNNNIDPNNLIQNEINQN